jgi:hypothetical protein
MSVLLVNSELTHPCYLTPQQNPTSILASEHVLHVSHAADSLPDLEAKLHVHDN